MFLAGWRLDLWSCRVHHGAGCWLANCIWKWSFLIRMLKASRNTTEANGHTETVFDTFVWLTTHPDPREECKTLKNIHPANPPQDIKGVSFFPPLIHFHISETYLVVVALVSWTNSQTKWRDAARLHSGISVAEWVAGQFCRLLNPL